MTSITENMDCMDAMRSFPDKYFDLAIVDPPYGIGEDGSKNRRRKNERKKTYKPFYGNDKTPPPPEYFKALFRVSKNQIVWGANHFMQNICLGSPCWIVWDKHTEACDFADCELAWTSFKTAVKKFDFTWSGFRQGDQKNKEERIHPTQKPVALYKWILQNYAKAGDKILDTHLGSGSSRIAAYDMGFDFWGYELDAEYFEKQEQRFRAHVSKPVLFQPHEMYATGTLF